MRAPHRHLMSNLFLPYDLYERHQVVSRLLRKRDVHTVLDVGGNLGVLKQFLDAEILALNVGETADLYYDGRAIPFGADHFDAVASLDTLEHIPNADRLPFLQECLRVARRYLVISAPYGSDEHRAYEQKLEALYTQTLGIVHTYLNEHVRYGIPNQQDIDRLLRRLAVPNYQLYFAGDFVWQCRNFERMIIYHQSLWLKHFIGWTSMALFHRIRLTTQPYSHANRFYVLIEKQGR
jgi:SAM-dependent methyltransferase